MEKGLWGRIRRAYEEFESNLHYCMVDQLGQTFQNDSNPIWEAIYIAEVPESVVGTTIGCTWQALM